MKKIILAVALSGLFLTSAAQAATDTATMAVSATVSGTCKITTNSTPMAFGPIDPSTVSVAPTATSTFSYKCTTGKSPTALTDDKGANEVGVQMRMASGGNFLNYGIAYTATLAAGTGFGSGSTATTITVNGTIPLNDAQNAVAATYGDSVIFTLTF